MTAIFALVDMVYACVSVCMCAVYARLDCLFNAVDAVQREEDALPRGPPQAAPPRRYPRVGTSLPKMESLTEQHTGGAG